MKKANIKMQYPNALVTVRAQELTEEFNFYEPPSDYVFTTYTKHYYIGSERISSKLGTRKDLGIMCEQLGLYPDLIDEMNRRVNEAGEQMNSLYSKLDKDLRLPKPHYYDMEHALVCSQNPHHPDLYDAYWYHPDHLGSSSFITNTTGEISQHMEYLPFGETLVEEHLNSYNSPFKFNAKEFDSETGWHYYGARYYDSKWSIWLSVDKKAHRAPQYSPYIYSFNSPVTFFDPDGNWPWPVTIRSFISSGSAGLGTFRGDGRPTSTQSSPHATSRVETTFTVDPSAKTISSPKSRSDDTVFYGIGNPLTGPYLPPKANTAEPSSSISNKTTYRNAISFDFEHSAKDPITPSLITPDLDVQASLLMIENTDAKMLSITGIFTGDAFPSTEAFVEDQGGNRLLIGAHKERGGLLNLFGKNKRSTFNVNMIIEFDDNGVFTRVHEDNKTYSPQQWEKEVQSRFNN